MILCPAITVTSIRGKREKSEIINDKLIECGIKMKIKTNEVTIRRLYLSLKNIVHSIQFAMTMFVCIMGTNRSAISKVY